MVMKDSSSKIPSDIQMPSGLAIVGKLGENGMFRTIQAVESLSQNDRTRTVVVRMISPRAAALSDIEGRVLRFFRKYQEIISFAYLPRLFSLSSGHNAGLIIKEEFIKGVRIAEFREKNPGADLLPLLKQICEALHCAHQKAILHLCITPSRVVVNTDDGRIRLLGFGAAAFPEPSPLIDPQHRQFVAPEILKGHSKGPASDIYSMAAFLKATLPDLAENRVIRSNLDQDPSRRCRSARDFGALLADILLRGKPTQTKPPAGKLGPARIDKSSGGLIPKSGSGGLQPRLTIVTNPSGADVFVLDALVGRTDESGIPVLWNRGPITIQKDGYRRVRLDYKETPSRFHICVDLEPAFVPVRILTQPLGARVAVDGTDMGLAEEGGVRIKLPLGRKRVSLTKLGYEKTAYRIEVKGHGPLKIGPLKLQAKKIAVTTDPGGAYVFLGDELLGTTDEGGVEAPWDCGPLTIEKEGYRQVRKAFDGPPDETSLHIKMTPYKDAGSLVKGELPSLDEVGGHLVSSWLSYLSDLPLKGKLTRAVVVAVMLVLVFYLIVAPGKRLMGFRLPPKIEQVVTEYYYNHGLARHTGTHRSIQPRKPFRYVRFEDVRVIKARSGELPKGARGGLPPEGIYCVRLGCTVWEAWSPRMLTIEHLEAMRRGFSELEFRECGPVIFHAVVIVGKKSMAGQSMWMKDDLNGIGLTESKCPKDWGRMCPFACDADY